MQRSSWKKKRPCEKPIKLLTIDIGNSLLTTLDETVKDVDGLHTKLKRKSELDGENQWIWRTYTAEVSHETEPSELSFVLLAYRCTCHPRPAGRTKGPLQSRQTFSGEMFNWSEGISVDLGGCFVDGRL
jgi:hypothetical protein